MEERTHREVGNILTVHYENVQGNFNQSSFTCSDVETNTDYRHLWEWVRKQGRINVSSSLISTPSIVDFNPFNTAGGQKVHKDRGFRFQKHIKDTTANYR